METPRTNLSPATSPWKVVGLLAALAAATGLGAFAWLQLRVAPPPPATPPPVAAAPAEAAPEPALAAPSAAEPPAAEVEAAPLLGRASANPLFQAWLAAGDVIRRWVVVTANLAHGESPRRALPFLAPKAPFSTAADGGRTVMAPEACARYDAVADAVASVDAHAVATAYRRLRGVLTAAWTALGNPGTLDRATVRALWRISNAPVPVDPVALAPKGGVWAFADPKLEALSEVEKHLVRMGPRNQRLLQAKARELLAALTAPAAAPADPAAPAPRP